MVRIVMPDGGSFHEPPYTLEEQADIARRSANVTAFTRPAGRPAAPAQDEKGKPDG